MTKFQKFLHMDRLFLATQQRAISEQSENYSGLVFFSQKGEAKP